MSEEKGVLALAGRLASGEKLSAAEFSLLTFSESKELEDFLREKAVEKRKAIYGNKVFVRGLIEITNYCRNDCFYCGIRRSNRNADRYRLSEEEILSCAEEGYALGFRTFVLQGGEDPFFGDERLCGIVEKLKKAHPDCAVTLSMGERSEESFRALRNAGTDRYLLRHETATKAHYEKLHPAEMSFERRMECLETLRSLGFQVGAGFMVGSPFQTEADVGRDLEFIQGFQPEMCGIGPFIPQKDTPFAGCPAGTPGLTLRLLSIIRLVKPNILLPATTALGTIDPAGREKGILSGANVVMPNLSPVGVREKYALYDGKICTGDESAQCRNCLSMRMKSIGYEIVVDRGDIK